MLWILFSLLSALCYATEGVVNKYLLSKLIKKPIILLMVISVLGFFISVVIYFFNGFSKMSNLNLALALFAGIIYTFASWFYFEAIKIEEISRVVPLIFLNPLFIALLSFIFLNELFTYVKY